ncbi:MAG: molybdopterin-guanine dinucleotide biosynthesis protein B [Desulfobacteraceae bacterium]
MKINRKQKKVPAVIIAGWSGSGKTTLVEKLLPALKKKKLKVGTVKHHHGALSLDKPGKDSWRHRQAGADKTIIASPDSVGMIMTINHEPVLDELLYYMSDMDIVVVEGFKKEKWPKVEIFRSAVHEKPGFLDDPDLIAIASDTELESTVPVFDLDNPEKLADFIADHFYTVKSA